MFLADNTGPAAHTVDGTLATARTDGINESLLFLQPILSQFLFPDIQARISLPSGIHLLDVPVAAVSLPKSVMDFPSPLQGLVEAIIPFVPDTESPEPG